MDIHGYLSTSEGRRPVHGDSWGAGENRWIFNEECLALYYGHTYWHVLERMTTTARLADAIFQARTHGFDIGALIDALTDLLDPQANPCSWGVEKKFNPTKWLRRPRARKQGGGGENELA